VMPRDRLHACGLVLVNPPRKLEGEIKLLLPALVAALTKGNGGSHRLDWLAREK
jgi:23S rRNA A2030 N6-methylase RlmJ